MESGNLPLQDPMQNGSKCNESGVQNQVLCVSPPGKIHNPLGVAGVNNSVV